MRRAIFISYAKLEQFYFKMKNSFLSELFWGSLAGISLALAFKPTEFRLLAPVSTLLLTWRMKKILIKDHSLSSIFFLILSFLFFSRFLYFRNDYFLLMNKTQLITFAYPMIFLLMIVQIIILPLIMVMLIHALMRKRYLKESSLYLFSSLFLTFILIDLGSYWTILTTPIIPIGNTLKWLQLFSFWEHLGVTFFYYAVISSLFLHEKARALMTTLLILVFITPLFFLKKEMGKKQVQLITINQKFSITNADNTFSPNPLDYLDQISAIMKEDKSVKTPIFLWNEAAIIQLPQNPKVVENLKLKINQKLPYTHFLGNIVLQQANWGLLGKSRYDLVGNSKSQAFHQKNYLVPIDENTNYFPWLPHRFYLNLLSIEKGNRMGILEGQGAKFGILLCNEVAEVFKLSMRNYFADVDIILNPSNVPDLYENTYEEFLDEHAEWISLVTNKPVLRTSNSGRVSLFFQGRVETNFKVFLNSKMINLKY